MPTTEIRPKMGRPKMGRPGEAWGIWPDMIEAAGGSLSAFAAETGIPFRTALRFPRGQSMPVKRHREACLEFARAHAVRSRAYVNPQGDGSWLVSAPDGWWVVQNRPGGWEDRKLVHRADADWSGLHELEVDWALFWRRVG